MDEDCLYWLTMTNLRRRDFERFYFAKRFVGQITCFLEIIVGEVVYNVPQLKPVRDQDVRCLKVPSKQTTVVKLPVCILAI